MAITVNSVTTNLIAATSSSISVTTPAASVGDLLVIILSNDYYDLADMSLTSITPTATATEMTSFGSDGGAGSQPNIKGWWAPVVSAGAVTVIADTGHSDEEKVLAVYLLSGADTTSPVDDSTSIGAIASGTDLSAPSVSPATATALLICHLQTDGITAAPGSTLTPPGTMSNAYNLTDGTFMRAIGASQLLSASGATGTRTWTGTRAGVNYTAASVAIKALIIPNTSTLAWLRV
jgi:hypothetical protein